MSHGEIPLAGAQSKKSKRDYLARFISDVANPLFLPSIIFILIGWQILTSNQIFLLAVSVALVFYTIIPLNIVFFLLKKGHISSLDAPEHQTRNRLFSYSIISSFAGSIILFSLFQHSNPFLANLAIIYLINPVIGLLINLKWKISIHTASLAMSVTILAFFFISMGSYSNLEATCLSLGMLLLILPMIWARYHLQVHTISELLGGTAIGVLLTLAELGLIL